jgi:hypothetical protein
VSSAVRTVFYKGISKYEFIILKDVFPLLRGIVASNTGGYFSYNVLYAFHSPAINRSVEINHIY